MHLEEDENDGLFHCPVPDCHNDRFGTQRGCRKHVKKKHSWFYYFDEKPSDSDVEASRSQMEKEKGQRLSSNGVPSFDMSCTFAEQFTAWLKGSGGGCKSDRQAQQLISKCLKFLKFCSEDEDHLTLDIVDFCLCSPNLLFKFFDSMQSEWQLGHAGRIGYLDAIAELVTYSKVNGASEAVLSGLSTTDTYLKKMRKTVSKMMRLQWTSDLDIDVLEAKGHWATMDELLGVVSRYLPRYEAVLRTCKDTPVQHIQPTQTASPFDLSFATKFLAVYLFIQVKGSRPMTYQYLTVDMVPTAKTNGGFVDQKMFKTAGKYGFDSLLLTDTNMSVLEGYITYIRPLLKPKCEYVLVTRNGVQHNKLGELMSKLVFEATGKYVHPTRYRQIVETSSCKVLQSADQSAISEDQKHSSNVAKVHYRKQRSREVATKARECLEKLHGDSGTKLDKEVLTRLSDLSNSSEDQDDCTKSCSSTDEVQKISTPPAARMKPSARKLPAKQKHEDAFLMTELCPARRKSLLFTPEEDKYLKVGLKRYGFGQWTSILRDPDFHFQKGRSPNSFLNRANRKYGTMDSHLVDRKG
ncbi:predicted protein [Nematostella vectensis]|uniref:Uncharacterized protein n=1 Tax=Nematostella vectensis TaxID=45351 RepID=A7RSX0_NEMVE|nr:predicted protein [Nematostella vectensis]|eukprot:XP_001637552.1 predicted protein [Nematostella vectensis]